MNALPDRYASDALVLRHPSDGRTLAQRLTKRYAARITGAFVVPGREGSFAPLPDDLPPALAQALRSRGIDQLYSHQAEAWAATYSWMVRRLAQWRVSAECFFTDQNQCACSRPAAYIKSTAWFCRSSAAASSSSGAP
jgi:hypothetical protein